MYELLCGRYSEAETSNDGTQYLVSVRTGERVEVDVRGYPLERSFEGSEPVGTRVNAVGG